MSQFECIVFHRVEFYSRSSTGNYAPASTLKRHLHVSLSKKRQLTSDDSLVQLLEKRKFPTDFSPSLPFLSKTSTNIRDTDEFLPTEFARLKEVLLVLIINTATLAKLPSIKKTKTKQAQLRAVVDRLDRLNSTSE